MRLMHKITLGNGKVCNITFEIEELTEFATPALKTVLEVSFQRLKQKNEIIRTKNKFRTADLAEAKTVPISRKY